MEVDLSRHGRGVQVVTRIPKWCCEYTTENEKNISGPVSTGALIAMFDEVSTYAGAVLWDRIGRPGLSILLSAALRNHDTDSMPVAGDDIR